MQKERPQISFVQDCTWVSLLLNEVTKNMVDYCLSNYLEQVPSALIHHTVENIYRHTSLPSDNPR